MTVYLYLLDTLADWEIGYLTAELNSRRFFRADAPRISLKTVGLTREPIHTMGGLCVVPDCTVAQLSIQADSALLLPGAMCWDDPKQRAILEAVPEFLAKGATVGAICGATAALANLGLLDARPHTSNGPGFLEMAAPGYQGTAFYVNSPSVADGGLITASCTGALLWTKLLLSRFGVFRSDTLEAWYQYFSTGTPEAFFALMQTLPSAL